MDIGGTDRAGAGVRRARPAQEATGAGGIAIVGMSGRFPGAPDLDSFWANLKAGVDSISRFPIEELELRSIDRSAIDRSTYVAARGLLRDVDLFDARFFGYLPREAELMDPQQRIFLELCWQAVEHAGYDAQRYPGSIGVFAGSFMNSYLLANLCSSPAFLAHLVESFQAEALQTELGNDKDYLATHVAFRLGLRGPALTLQTACSTSLVAIATACQSLAARQCDMALAGGITIVLPQKRGYRYTEGSILSRDGRCRAFDERASGTVFSNGGAVVLLKRLEDAVEDADTIYAVIRGYAVNNDGSRKVNYTAPSIAGQAEVISQALQMADIDPRTVGYVEAHGTATPMGDPIEVSGLTKAYRAWTPDSSFCALGSVKSNIGHLDVAAGVAGLIKAALAVQEGVLPPSVNYEHPNSRIDFAASPFYVNNELRQWPPSAWPRRAGVSAFGVGGTNAHVIVEQPPVLPAAQTAAQDPDPTCELFVLSARTQTALDAACEQLAGFVAARPQLNIRDAAFTLQLGRREFDQRRIVVADTAGRLVESLRGPAGPGESGQLAALRPPVVFMFPGQGSQYPGMARDLYRNEPIFRQVIDRCAALLRDDPESGLDLRSFLLCQTGEDSAADDRLAREMAQTQVAQPAIFAFEVALARLLLSWGLKPAALVGHSVGEFAAATVAGLFELEDALRLVAARGRLMQALPAGKMIAVRKAAQVLREMLPEGLSIAAINAPEMTVVSGPGQLLDEFSACLDREGMQSSQLRTSHAFHSPMMAEAVAPLVARIEATRRGVPDIEICSTLLGRAIAAGEFDVPAYWGRQILSPVLFSDAAKAAAGNGRRVLLEVGPRQALAGFARQTLGDEGCLAIVPAQGQAIGPQSEHAQLLAAVGKLWVAGVSPDWKALHTSARRRIALPTYPFERKRFWVAPEDAAMPRPASVPSAVVAPADANPGAGDPATVAATTEDGTDAGRRTAILDRLRSVAAALSGYPAKDLSESATFMQLGFDSLFMTQLATTYQAEYGIKLTFRQLLQEHPTLGALADHIDTVLPAETVDAARGGDLPDLGRLEQHQDTGSDTRRVFPMTEAQQELWFTSQTGDLASCAFNESDAFRITGALDADLLSAAVVRSLERHEAFRLRFDPDGESQWVDPAATFTVSQTDLSGCDEQQRAAQLAALIAQEALTPFDLERGPVARARLVRMHPHSHILLLYFHHLVFDGYSGKLVMQEIARTYNAGRRGLAPPSFSASPYSVYVHRSQLPEEKSLQAARAYWKSTLALDPPAPLELPTDRPRKPLRGYSGGTIHREFDGAFLGSMRALAKGQSTTLFTILLAGFEALLSRVSAQDDLVVAIPAAGQSHLGVEAVGYCVNALPIRSRPAQAAPFSRLVRENQQAILDALDHQDVSLGAITRLLRLPVSPSRLPLAEVMFNFSSFHTDLEVDGCVVVAHENPRLATFYDLFLHIVESNDRLIMDWDYATDLFDADTIERWLDHYRHLMLAAAADPERPIGELPLFSRAQGAAAMAAWKQA